MSRAMIVMKFGGTSMGGAEPMRRVASIIEARQAQHPAVVVSAVSKVTDQLLKTARAAQAREATAAELLVPLKDIHRRIADELDIDPEETQADLTRLGEALHGVYLLRELTPRSMDFLLSFGELVSSKLLAALLCKRGLDAKSCPGWEIGVLTDDQHGEANVLAETYPTVKAQVAPMLGVTIPVITGFTGCTKTGERTTLGRGGSDFSAAIVGRALGAEEVQIWTDVCGIMSCDPRIVKDAYTVRRLSFEEAAELAYFGAKVLHPKTVEPAIEAGIPVRVVNTFEPDDPGTLVKSRVEGEDGGPSSHPRRLVGLAVKRGNLLVNLVSTRMVGAEGYLARVFETLARHRVSVDCISTSEVSVSLTMDGRYEAALASAIEELQGYVRTTVLRGRSLVCVVGEGLGDKPGLAGGIFTVLGEHDVNVEFISQGASELNITFSVNDADADRALVALHERFLIGR